MVNPSQRYYQKNKDSFKRYNYLRLVSKDIEKGDCVSAVIRTANYFRYKVPYEKDMSEMIKLLLHHNYDGFNEERDKMLKKIDGKE